jgi:hypothetical protein
LSFFSGELLQTLFAFVMNIRTLLVLGRISNLPTVWSNLLAGWILNWGGFRPFSLALLLVGGSFLYTGGMFLNDFCDAEFDALYCPQRPIPAGKISRQAVGQWAILWFVLGFACLAFLGAVSAIFALVLIAAIILYDFRHKGLAWAPLVMGLCRFLLYPLAAVSVGATNVFATLNLFVVPAGVALGLYVAGITYLARGESRPEKPARWALLLLFLPVATSLGIFLLQNMHRPVPPGALALACLLQLYWMAWMLVPFWRKSNPSLGRVVSGLLAGIVLIDVLMATLMLGPLSAALLPLFALAFLLQRFVPAT